ncbi:MAG: type III-B CRISPR module RAMP protein Cmr6 [Deltaproteobacteria bacterium]|nr:MAG: type III-B CRISPR module RAMP protein Cmr6 [Deltaproteobacteria bacterium]
MGKRPLYKGHASGASLDRGHPGLGFFRFFDGYSHDWKIEVTKTSNPKLDFIRRFARPVGNVGQLAAFLRRREALTQALGAAQRVLQLDGPFVTGTGLEHPVENGFLWHPTLGTPHIPGSTVKGLLRAWMEGWAGVETEKIRRWFGAGSDTDGAGTAGSLIFFDAVPVAPVLLFTDVMTPHMGKWYEQGLRIQNINKDHEKIPADWHDPVPVPFLVVREASFHFMIAARTPEVQEHLPDIMKHLETALATIGIGAKTAVGYGRFRSAASENPSRNQSATSFSRATPEPDPEAVARVEARYEEASQYPEAIQPWIVEAEKPASKDRLLQHAEEWLSILESMNPLHRESVEFFANWLDERFKDIMANPDKTQGKKKKPAFKPHQIAIAKRLIALLNKTA